MTPIFVCGVGRSGTSLVQSMIGSHSEVVFLPETAFIRRFIASRILERAFHRNGIAGAYKLVNDDYRVSSLAIDMGKLFEEPFNIGKTDIFSGAEVYSALMKKYLKRSGKKYIGDKDPRLVEYLPLIKHYWPRAYIVHVIRDPRDVLASKKKADWSKKRHWLLHVFANRVQLKLGRKYGKAFFSYKYQEVIYEELISEPEKVLKEVCAKLGISYEKKMLKFSSTAETLVNEYELPWKKETLGPLLSNNTGKWKNCLKDFEVALTEIACERNMKLGNYTDSNRILELSGLRRYLVKSADIIFKLADYFYVRYRYISQ